MASQKVRSTHKGHYDFVNEQLLNSSKLGESLEVSHHSVKSYVDIMGDTFILRVLPPYFLNLKRRLVKSPKIFIRDTGLLHALLDIRTGNDLLGHPVYGSSWEGFVIENILAALPDWHSYFYQHWQGRLSFTEFHSSTAV